MKAHIINTNTNPEPLKHLKTLLAEGNIAKILNYVKGEFSENIDTYIDMAEKVSNTENELLHLQIESTERQKNYVELVAEINASINKDLEEMKKD